MRHRIHVSVWGLFLVFSVAWQTVLAQEKPAVEQRPTVVQVYRPRNPDRSSAARDKIHKALDEPTSLEFVETPLTDVIDYLKDLHGIEIQISYKALEDSGVGTDTPVTKNLRGISLDAALHLMLGPMNLVHLIEDEVLLITTQEQAGHSVSLRAYDCRWAADRIPRLVEVLTLAKRIGLPTDEKSLAAAEQFTIEPAGKILTMRATALQHDTIERLLIDLRHIDERQGVDAKATQQPATKQPAAQDK